MRTVLLSMPRRRKRETVGSTRWGRLGAASTTRSVADDVGEANAASRGVAEGVAEGVSRGVSRVVAEGVSRVVAEGVVNALADTRLFRVEPTLRVDLSSMSSGRAAIA